MKIAVAFVAISVAALVLAQRETSVEGQLEVVGELAAALVEACVVRSRDDAIDASLKFNEDTESLTVVVVGPAHDSLPQRGQVHRPPNYFEVVVQAESLMI